MDLFQPSDVATKIANRPGIHALARGGTALRLLPALFLCAFLLSCDSGDSRRRADPDELYTYGEPAPLDDGWEVSHLSDAGIEVAPIEAMIRAVHDGSFINIDSVAIARNGVLVLDELLRTRLSSEDREAGNGDLGLHRVFSVTKSVTSALVGIALDRGIIGSLDDNVYGYFPEYSPFEHWDARKAATTLHHFLTMQHGLDWDEFTYPYTDSRNDLIHSMETCSDWVRCFLDLPTAADPGTRFTYSTHATLTLGAIVEARSGVALETFADQYLFAPLGIDYYRWSGDSPSGRALAGSGLMLTTRDMAKFGQLYLNGGEWRGQQIVAESWVADSVAMHVEFTEYRRSTGYGYQWWLDRFPYGDGSTDGFHAVGYGGQYIFVFPALALVVAFTSSNYEANDEPGQVVTLLERYVLPAIR